MATCLLNEPLMNAARFCTAQVYRRQTRPRAARSVIGATCAVLALYPVRGIGDAARHVAADFIVQPLNHRRTASAVTDTSGTATMNRAVMFP